MDNDAPRKPVARLFPEYSGALPLEGLYLGQNLHQLAAQRGKPLVYSNFVSSLDGRIAVEVAGRTSHAVPDTIANPRDWRLYQELAGQADLLITSGRFFRQSHAGEAQDLLPVGSHPDFDDIRAWRATAGLNAQPDILIMSNSLDFPLSSLQSYRSRRILVATGAHADKQRMQELEKNGMEILLAGSDDRVDGRQLQEQLVKRGYLTVYAIAGPAVLHTLMQAGVLDRLYLTFACRLLGGDSFDTLVRGTPFIPPASFRLKELYHDPHAPEGAGQLFCVFDKPADS